MLADRIILKHNDAFIATDLKGDVPSSNPDGLGLYRSDTRFLSTYELRINGRRPVLLNQGVDRAYVATFQLVNPRLEAQYTGGPIPQQSLSLRRTRFMHNGMHERIGLKNCNRHAVELELELSFGADYRDMFMVRGYQPHRELGTVEPPAVTGTGLQFAYQGLDGHRRTTDVILDPVPRLAPGRANMTIALDPQETFVLLVDIVPSLAGDRTSGGVHFDVSLEEMERRYRAWNESCTTFRSSNDALDGQLLWRNLEDLRVLCEERPSGLFPTAGLPWFAVPFGRDALITAVQTLALNPDLAVGSLRFLAQHQGTKVDPGREEEPGKIPHELRSGEMANLGLIPHTPYFGTIDATPLFLVVLVELLNWTGDDGLLTELLPNVTAALEWIDSYGDPDGDGLVEYELHAHSGGLRNHGWKDSWDSLIATDGEPAPPPAALVEVQAYVYQAKAGLARIFRRTGRQSDAERLEREAGEMQRRLHDRYWMQDQRFYAQALDRDKQQVRSISSNVGHCLWAGALDPRRAADVVARLMAPDMFSGWGIRTLSATTISYNPMSYHNGSVWPHDNSIIASGMRRYGFAEEAERVATAVLQACLRFSDYRIPELFCGFARDGRFHAGPGEQLVSCSPQAWGAGSLFHFLQVLTGVEANAFEGRLRIDPLRTSLFRRLRVEGMRVAGGEVDFTVECGDTVRVLVDRSPAGLELELPVDGLRPARSARVAD